MQTLPAGRRLQAVMWLVHPTGRCPSAIYPDPQWREEEQTASAVGFSAPVRVFPSRQAAEFVADASNGALEVSAFHVVAGWRTAEMARRTRAKRCWEVLRGLCAVAVIISALTVFALGVLCVPGALAMCLGVAGYFLHQFADERYDAARAGNPSFLRVYVRGPDELADELQTMLAQD